MNFMETSSQLSAKKQQSLSSFFTRNATNKRPLSTLDRDTTRASNTSIKNQDGDEEGVGTTFTSEREDDETPSPGIRHSDSPTGVLQDVDALPYAYRGKSTFGIQSNKRRRLSSHRSESRIGPSTLLRISPTTSKTPNPTSKYLFSSSPHSDGERDTLSPETVATRERLHERFIKKLGYPDSIAEIKKRNWQLVGEGAEEQLGADDIEDVDDEPTAKAPSKCNRKPTGKKISSKLTPMEKQFLEIKHQNMDTLLVVEVGYKFKFFGEDAQHAAKELSIVCIPGKMRYDEHFSEAHLDRFASASIPVHRLHVHVKRLVAVGYKVGVVRQIETAALKAAGDNRNAPFIRKLTNLYTKGTYIDDVGALEGIENISGCTSLATGYLVCLTENNAKGWGNDEKVQIGLVAVQPATGDVTYDDFEDGFMRSEIETRLLHIAPCEILIVGQMSKATEKLVQHLSGSKSNVFREKVRIERVEKPKNMPALSYSHVSNFYTGKMQASTHAENERTSNVLNKVLQLSENVTLCLSAMISHLTAFGLEHVFHLTKYFQSFSSRSHMLLNGTTLTSLEIYQNQTDHTEKGSLFWTLDRTKTRFGKRLLRKWVGRPLLMRSELERRAEAVEELLSSDRTATVERIQHVLSQTKSDLERSLIRIYYGKCTRPELLTVLQTMQRIATHFAHIKSAEDSGFQSRMISEAIIALPVIGDDVISFLEKMNPQAAKDNDKYNFFRDQNESESVLEHKLGIASVEQELIAHKVVAAEILGRKKVEYVTVAGIEYLIEVDNINTKRVPASWAKISGTKKTSRYHTPEVIRLIRERDQHKEALAAACDVAYAAFLSEIATKYQVFRDCVQALATLDCLLSLASIAEQPDYVKPTYTDETCITIKEGRHPMVEQLLLDAYVPNDIHLTSDSTRALLVTGPNMGGKSSYVRQVALIAIMAQIGSYVPAASAKLGMLDAVFTRMGAFDNMMAGESTFMVELSETSDILKQASPRSLVILDELGRGTSTHDGVAIAQAVLDHVVRKIKSLTLFITHYQSLSSLTNGFENGELKNVHMKFHEGGEDGRDITFLYEVGEGVAHRSYGLNVARLAQVPEGVLQVAAIKSAQLEEVAAEKSIKHLSSLMSNMLEKVEDTGLEQLVAGIEQL